MEEEEGGVDNGLLGGPSSETVEKVYTDELRQAMQLLPQNIELLGSELAQQRVQRFLPKNSYTDWISYENQYICISLWEMSHIILFISFILLLLVIFSW